MNNKSQNVPVDLKIIIAEEEEYKKEKHNLVEKYATDLEKRRSQLTSTIQTVKEKLKKLENRAENSVASSKIEPKKKEDIQKQISDKYINKKDKAVTYLKENFFS